MPLTLEIVNEALELDITSDEIELELGQEGNVLTDALLDKLGASQSEAEVRALLDLYVARQARQGNADVWPVDKIEDLPAAKIVSGEFDNALIPANIARTSQIPTAARIGTLAADQVADWAETGNAAAIPVAKVPEIQNVRTAAAMRVWVGTQAQYDAIAAKDATTLYVIPGT